MLTPEETMQKPAYEPMNAAELMDRVFDVYKKTFAKQLAFSALIGVISFLFMMILGVVAGMAVIMPSINNTETAMTGMIVAMVAVMLPVYWVWTATAEAGHIILSQQAFYLRPIRMPVRRLPGIVLRVLGASLAQLILSIPWALLIFLCIYMMLRSSGSFAMDDLPYVLTVFTSGLWLVISIGGAFVYVVYSNVFALAVPVAVFEKCSLFKAVARSWRLIKGEFWKILGIRILWTVVVYLFTYSAQGLWALATMLINGVSGSAFGVSLFMGTAGSLLQSLMTIAVSFLIGPLGGILTALLYFNQRIKKEGLDIEIKLEHLQVKP